MSRIMDRIGSAFRNRRVQMAGAAALSAAALLSIGFIAVLVAAKPQPAEAEMADHGALSVEMQPAPKTEAAAMQGKMATLDPAQIAVLDQRPTPPDPALQAMLDEERADRAKAMAEQRTFDAKLKAELADTPIDTPDRPATAAPTSEHTSTSNSVESVD